MFRAQRNAWSILVLVLFALGLLGGAVLCGDDHAQHETAADHCALHCLCYVLSLPAATADGPNLSSHRCRWVDPPLNLPAFAASIFIPPKA